MPKDNKKLRLRFTEDVYNKKKVQVPKIKAL